MKNKKRKTSLANCHFLQLSNKKKKKMMSKTSSSSFGVQEHENQGK
jgi:hypothetical protein